MALRFQDLEPNLLPETLKAIDAFGFDRMTPVQNAAIPLFLQNKDVCVEAVTGSGKTLAFLVPVLERLARLTRRLTPTQVGAVIVSPTRELATQTHGVLMRLLAGFGPGDEEASPPAGLAPLLLLGGRPVEDDLKGASTSGCNIIVATPGRLIDLMRRTESATRSASAEAASSLPVWTALEVLVLDEADRLLGMGFKEALDEILGRLPKQRRTGLFSATQTREVKALARAGMRNPVTLRVRVQNESTAAALGGAQRIPARLENTYITCREDDKPLQLVQFLRDCEAESTARMTGEGSSPESDGVKVVVFFLTCAAVDYFATVLPPLLRHGPEEVVSMLDRPGDDARHQAARELLPRSGTGRLAASSKAAARAAAAAAAAADMPPGLAWRTLAGLKAPSTAAEAIAMASPDSLPLFALHGRMEPKRRNAALEGFQKARAGVLLCTDVAARGIDVPDVDWIVQFDPPSDPSFFVHRIGRTARAGRSGAALVLLLPAEAGYVELLRDVHRVPMARRRNVSGLIRAEPEAPLPEGAEAEDDDAEDDGVTSKRKAGAKAAAAAEVAKPAGAAAVSTAVADHRAARNLVCRSLRLLSAADRDVMEKATRAFVSFARGYAEHALTYVFRFDAVDVPRLAKSLGLLKLPSVKEFRGVHKDRLAYRVDPKDVWLPADPRARAPIPDTSSVAYLDSAKERTRQTKLEDEHKRAEAAAEALGVGAAHAERVKMAGKGVHAALEKARREAKREAAEAQEKRVRKRKSRSTKLLEDWDELANEERLARRLKQGKISQAEFDRATGEDVADDDSDADMDGDDAKPAGGKGRKGAVPKRAKHPRSDEDGEAMKQEEAEGGAKRPKLAKAAAAPSFRAAVRYGGLAALRQPADEAAELAASTAAAAPSSSSGRAGSGGGGGGGTLSGKKLLKVAGMAAKQLPETTAARAEHKGSLASRAMANARKQANSAARAKSRYATTRNGGVAPTKGKSKGKGKPRGKNR